MSDYKIAVIGDIHSNHIALEKCISHALERKADEFLFLGDYISDCPYPQRTMKVIYEMDRKYNCRFIRGNREDYIFCITKIIPKRDGPILPPAEICSTLMRI